MGHRRPTGWPGVSLARGLAPGDRVVLAIAPDEPFAWLIAYTAVHRAGADRRPGQHPAGRARAPRDPRPRRALGRPRRYRRAVGGVRWTELAPEAIADARRWWPRPTATTAHVDWARCSTPDADRPGRATVAPAEGDVMDIMYTSGTTGAPRPWWCATGATTWPTTRAAVERARLPDRLAVLDHQRRPAHLRSDARRAERVVPAPLRRRHDWLSTVEDRRPVVAFLVPAMAQLIVAHPRFADADLSSLAALTIGGAPIARATLRAPRRATAGGRRPRRLRPDRVRSGDALAVR